MTTQEELRQVKETIIKEMEWRYSHQTISVRAMCELVFYVIDHYNDPNLHFRVLDKLLGGGDGHGST